MWGSKFSIITSETILKWYIILFFLKKDWSYAGDIFLKCISLYPISIKVLYKYGTLLKFTYISISFIWKSAKALKTDPPAIIALFSLKDLLNLIISSWVK